MSDSSYQNDMVKCLAGKRRAQLGALAESGVHAQTVYPFPSLARGL